MMRDYMEALAVGVTVGVLYGLLKFRSPAPPLIALVGLFGMLIGEQITVQARTWLFPAAAAARPAAEIAPPRPGEGE